MKKQKKIIASFLTAAFLIGGTTCYAASVGCTLTADKRSVSTAILGNTTGTYRFTSSNSKLSKYSAEAYMYAAKDSASAATCIKKYTMSADLVAHISDIKVSKKNYTLAKAYTFGNIKSNPLKGCMASTILSNK